jgi:hypothetical protein
MSKMTFNADAAKSICTAAEFKIYEQAQPKQLESLTIVQLKSLVTRSRTARDKWRDVSRGQKRTSQATKGHRQTADNARSKDKALLLTEVHQAFVDRLQAVENNQATAKQGDKEPVFARSDRKIVHRAVRSINREILKDEKRKINKAAKKKASKKKAAATKQAASEVKPSASKKASTPKTTTKKATAKKVTAKKVTAKKAASKSRATKKPVVTAARKRALALKAESQNSDSTNENGTSTEPKLGASMTNAANAARNRPIQAKSSKGRIQRGGGTRIKGHISSAGKRSQGRRDSK